jgi:hypothetical protein
MFEGAPVLVPLQPPPSSGFSPVFSPCSPEGAAEPMPCPTAEPWRIQVVEEEGKPQLEMRVDNTALVCDHMVLKVGGETLKLEITGKQIQVSGSFLKATGDRLTHNRADGSLLLEGKVKLSYSKNGQKAEITAQRIAVGVGDGSLVVPPTEDLGQQLFSFWTGLFR